MFRFSTICLMRRKSDFKNKIKSGHLNKCISELTDTHVIYIDASDNTDQCCQLYMKFGNTPFLVKRHKLAYCFEDQLQNILFILCWYMVHV